MVRLRLLLVLVSAVVAIKVGSAPALAQTPAPDWVRVTENAGWQARDSQGEFVYDDHMWILGGWFTPQTPNPRDVWKSPDGKN